MFARVRRLWLVPVIMMVASSVSSGGIAADDLPAVHGLLATQVHFTKEAGERVTAASLELLASCTASGSATKEDWNEALRRCHVRLEFDKPRAVDADDGKIEVTEAVVGFPLYSSRIWVRSGNKYTWFAKFRPELCSPIQKLLSEATPGEQ